MVKGGNVMTSRGGRHRVGLLQAAEVLEKLYPGAKERMEKFLDSGEVDGVELDDSMREQLLLSVQSGGLLGSLPKGVVGSAVDKAFSVIKELQDEEDEEGA